MPKITVSIPVYNVKDYLHQCVDSILSQTLQDIEVILVDDGSTDGSENICEAYACQDKRVRVFHKPNGGLASARQVGLENARGEYYIVCDSDDYVEPNMLEELYNMAMRHDVDMVVCDFFLNYPNGKQKKVSHNGVIFERLYLIGEAIGANLNANGWNKLVKTEFYKKHDISYEREICMGEDLLIFLKLLLHPITIAYLPKAFYHYRRDRNNNTYTNRPNISSFEQLLYINKWASSNFDNDKYDRAFFQGSVNLAFLALRIPEFPKCRYQELLKEQLPVNKFLRYHPMGLKVLLILFSKFSFGGARMLMNLLYKFFYK